MRTRELTPPRRRRPEPAPQQPVAIGLDLCRSALASLADEITECCVKAASADLHRHGLRGGIADDQGLRQAIRDIVVDNLCDMLAERLKEIDNEPDPRVRVRLTTHRETLVELLEEYRR